MICEHCGAEMVKEVRCCGGRDCSCHGELIEVEVDDCPNPNCFLDGMLGDGGTNSDNFIAARGMGKPEMNYRKFLKEMGIVLIDKSCVEHFGFTQDQKALDGKLFC